MRGNKKVRIFNGDNLRAELDDVSVYSICDNGVFFAMCIGDDGQQMTVGYKEWTNFIIEETE